MTAFLEENGGRTQLFDDIYAEVYFFLYYTSHLRLIVLTLVLFLNPGTTIRFRSVPDYGVVPIFGTEVTCTVGEIVTNAWVVRSMRLYRSISVFVWRMCEHIYAFFL